MSPFPPPGMGPGGPMQDPRHVWVYDTGALVGSFSDAGGGRWVEQNPTGSWVFQEMGRTPEFIELIDPARNHGARLFRDRSFHRPPGAVVWMPLYPGFWQ